MSSSNLLLCVLLSDVKAHRVSTVNFEYDFIDQYVDRLDEIFLDPTNGLFMVSEIVSVGGEGGKLYQNDPESVMTSLSHRDAMISLVTDLFYAESINPGSREAAIKWRNDSWNEWLGTGVFNEGRDYRMTWSTFENLDIEEAWSFYFDADQYERLRRIKKKVDPMNLFQNQFTIPIDEDDDDEIDADNGVYDNTEANGVEEEIPHSNNPWRYVRGFKAYFQRLMGY